MNWLSDPHLWIGLLTLTALEIVLGIDNVIFISILSGKLPARLQRKARISGLALAMITRILLLTSLSWIMGLTRPLFTVASYGVSGRSIILIAGGLFLLTKSTREIHHKIEDEPEETQRTRAISFAKVLTHIVLLDIVF